jgi:hypothetical protein
MQVGLILERIVADIEAAVAARAATVAGCIRREIGRILTGVMAMVLAVVLLMAALTSLATAAVMWLWETRSITACLLIAGGLLVVSGISAMVARRCFRSRPKQRS